MGTAEVLGGSEIPFRSVLTEIPDRDVQGNDGLRKSHCERSLNTVIPAEVMTLQYRAWIDSFPDPEQKLQSVQSKIPPRNRLTTVDEIATTTVFLQSDKSGHTTGQHIYVDGGYVHLDRSLT